MRIVIASQTYYPANNGQAVFTISLAEGLIQRGHQVMAITPSTSGQRNPAVVNGVQVQTLAAIPLAALHPNVHFTPLPDLKIWKLLADFRPDVVHIQDHYPLCHSVLRTARLRRMPVVGTNHFLPDNLSRNLPFARSNSQYFDHMLWRWMLDVFNQLDLVTTPTGTAAKILLHQGVRVPIVPVSCGVDTGRFCPDPKIDRRLVRQRYGLDPDKDLLMYVGRLDQEKRLDVLLKALSEIEADSIQLAIAGRGKQQPALQGLAADLNLGRRVVFTGFVPAADLPALLNSADLFVMPSTAELQSIATLEAMATSKPVLAADAQALPELVTNDFNGYTFEPNNAGDAARRLSQLLAERDRWEAMGRASLARARRHSLSNTLRRYEELYAALVQIKQHVRSAPQPLAWAQRIKSDLPLSKPQLFGLIKPNGRHKVRTDEKSRRR
jgi:glycosyltransferase involved in cell wall biosynthesis